MNSTFTELSLMTTSIISTTTAVSIINNSSSSSCSKFPSLGTLLPEYGHILLITLYSAITLLSLLGNITVLVVQFYGKESARNIRHYLINLAISDLILGVLCVPFTYHSFMHKRWIFPYLLCPIAQFAQLLSVFVTSMTLTIIGVERYIFTLYPMSRFQAQWFQSHGHIFLLITWLAGALYAYIPIYYLSDIYPSSTSASSNQTTTTSTFRCSLLRSNLTVEQRRFFLNTNFLLTFAIPCFMMTFCYVSIIRKLLFKQSKILARMNVNSAGAAAYYYSSTSSFKNRRNRAGIGMGNRSAESASTTTAITSCGGESSEHEKRRGIEKRESEGENGSGNHHQLLPENKEKFRVEVSLAAGDQSSLISSAKNKRKLNHIRSRLKTIKIMFTVIILYCACWAPVKFFQMLNEYKFIQYCTQTDFLIVSYTYIVCHWLAMCNCFLNPLVYSFMSSSFRNDFRRIVSGSGS